MSWNLGNPEIKAATPADAKAKLAGMAGVPQPIKDYVTAGIDGLAAKHGGDVRVTVTGSGHLCDVANKATHGTTTATIEVSKA